MPTPTSMASAGVTLALAAAPIPLPAWSHGARYRGRDQAAPAVAHSKSWSAADRPQVGHDAGVRRGAPTHPPPRPRARPRARAAGDPGNTISDFKFSPGTTTVHVGDTITWTNSGPSPHTATARDGSFETGTLAKGASASHTFTRSGSFAYICKLHPFMHGTVVVLAAASTPAPSSQSSRANPVAAPASGSTPAAAIRSRGPTLPVTGVSLPAIVSVGLTLLAVGWLVRRSGSGPQGTQP